MIWMLGFTIAVLLIVVSWSKLYDRYSNYRYIDTQVYVITSKREYVQGKHSKAPEIKLRYKNKPRYHFNSCYMHLGSRQPEYRHYGFTSYVSSTCNETLVII